MSDKFPITRMHYTCLNERHCMGPARDINPTKLVEHLVLDHEVHASTDWAKGTLGKLHTLVHAVIAYPELRELMRLPDGYGTGRHRRNRH